MHRYTRPITIPIKQLNYNCHKIQYFPGDYDCDRNSSFYGYKVDPSKNVTKNCLFCKYTIKYITKIIIISWLFLIEISKFVKFSHFLVTARPVFQMRGIFFLTRILGHFLRSFFTRNFLSNRHFFTPFEHYCFRLFCYDF